MPSEALEPVAEHVAAPVVGKQNRRLVFVNEADDANANVVRVFGGEARGQLGTYDALEFVYLSEVASSCDKESQARAEERQEEVQGG